MSDLTEELSRLQARFDRAVEEAGDEAALENVRVAYLGRNGEVTKVRRTIGTLAPQERPGAGKAINDAVAAIEARLEERQSRLQSHAFEEELAASIDVTFPATPSGLGSIHPVRRIVAQSCAYFTRHGFAVVVGPEAEPDYYNFDALNIPSDHPARESFDSFWLTGTMLLRPHTSPMQVRTMQQHAPPIAIVAPGKCYRRDAVDARHLFQFHQVEGLLVAEGIHFGHLKGMLTGLCRELFGSNQSVRFRPSYFPFTEPSAEVDTTCPKCRGTASTCNMCGGSGWIELGGSGMVHPNVLREVGYDPERYSGWAFGFGVERLGLARYEVDDIRRFITSEPDFLRQLS
ncbi:MAG TPA: phenylalanine--tRNA ligase subunit alpha [Candidatus Cybelea sp.]|jgi:phenylalanyl-tRNA synthetase alpha chain|nr:phenylalanine--tRNA ligase subunit alpha [Candidatus Cybelea sp.]